MLWSASERSCITSTPPTRRSLLRCAVVLVQHCPVLMEHCQGYFEKIVDILLDQMPSKIGTFERKSVVDSLHIAVPIIVEMLRRCSLPVLTLATERWCVAFVFRRKLP